MKQKKYLGIDLGTSHCAMALALPGQSSELIPILQADGPFQSFAAELLPSVVFLPDAAEIPTEQWQMPWATAEQPSVLVGRWARQLSVHKSHRSIRSAKSWLCFGERREGYIPLLPQGSSIEGKKTAQKVACDLLQHMRSSYCHESKEVPESLVLTVPASFDLLAREWTEQAAREAGWSEVSLLEEPLAAFYAWLDAHRNDWQTHLKPGDIILVCDIGGGTSDFSLISVGEDAGQLRLERCAVGRHLLLGGDNMDLALAYYLQDKHQLDLDSWQFQDLQQQARLAKEHLLSSQTDEHFPIALLGRGSQLFAQTISLEVQRSDVETLLVEGFFPICPAESKTLRRPASAMRETGLPYEQDAAITKHLAEFLQDFYKNLQASPALQERLHKGSAPFSGQPWPTHILLNGGVFHSSALRERLKVCVQSWCPTPLVELENPDFDHAVALGAAAFGAIQDSGSILRVRASAARSYYLGIAGNEPAVPGRKPQLQGLCILPQGTEEDDELSLQDQIFDLCLGSDLRFRLFSAKDRAGDQLGTLVRAAPDRLDELTQVSCHLTLDEPTDDQWLPVFVKSRLLSTGQLELSLQHRDSSHTWKLAFDLGAER